jgi:hypothetical protein
MSQTQNPDDFAYGRNQVNDCHCPALAAGFNPENTSPDAIRGMLEATEHYDSILKNRSNGERTGVVDERTAQEAWIEMLEQSLNRGWQRKNAALKVALELGWCDEEDYEL